MNELEARREFHTWCEGRHLRPSTLTELFGGRVMVRKGAAGVQFPTGCAVDRIRYFNPTEKSPKTIWSRKGGVAHWYGLDQARSILSGLEPRDRYLYIVNGEPSVWSCAQSGVAAVCTAAGESVPSQALLEELSWLAEDTDARIRVVFDRDEVGRTNAEKLARAFGRAWAEGDVWALELDPGLGPKGDVDDYHSVVGDAGLADALLGLPRYLWDVDKAVIEDTSHWHIAQVVAQEMRERGPQLVQDRDKLWRYDGKRGVWQAMEEAEVARRIGRHDGEFVQGYAEKPTRLKIGASTIRSVRDCIGFQLETPGYFDPDEARAGVQCSNGFLMLEGGKLRLYGSAPEWRQTFTIGVDYDPRVATPRWDAALASWFAGDEDADDKIACLQEFFGAAVFGLGVRFGKVLFLTGAGGNGKSQVINVLSGLFPRNKVSSLAPHRLQGEYYLASLAEARLNVCADIPASEILHTEEFKKAVTGDLLAGRQPRGRVFEFTPEATHIFSANELPGTLDQSAGFWRRLLVMRLNNDFSGFQGDEDLSAVLLRTERAGILAWAARGAERLLAQSAYTLPPSSASALAKWRTESDQVAMFLDEKAKRLKLVGAPKSSAMVKATEFYKAYRAWAEESGHSRMSKVSFGRRLTHLGVDRHKFKSGWYYHAQLLQEWELREDDEASVF